MAADANVPLPASRCAIDISSVHAFARDDRWAAERVKPHPRIADCAGDFPSRTRYNETADFRGVPTMSTAGPAATAARSNEYPIPPTMKAWVLGGPEELALVEKPVPEPGPAEVLVRIDAIAVCATDHRDHAARPAGDRSRANCPSTRASRPATNTWARWSSSGRPSTNSRSAIASRWRFMPGAAAASAAARACIPPASIMAFAPGPSRQRLQHRRRVRRICGQQRQHDGPCAATRCPMRRRR